ncbi:carboxypeptidase-like regulatory domain-containing protein [Dokdonella sp.]|uniref:carboxypeptidase-like regulatory domain-containing protein n=1 Tax=Dokdonella sp. TaxID=2291710 RepID=UPI003C38567E
MNLQFVSLSVIAVAVLLGIVRSLRSGGRWRWILVAGQLLMGVSIGVLLYPPSMERDPESAVVITAGVGTSQLEGIGADTPVIVLPEAPDAVEGIERVPDLASALRQHPGIGRLRVLGDGLVARDRPAAIGRGLAFEPTDEPAGLVELQVPDAVSAGTLWSLTGRIAGIADARVELIDRSGEIVATSPIDADGRFRLSTVARSNTRMLYQLRVLDAGDSPVDEIPVAIAARAEDSLSTIVVAGAPDAELKYLRRWIVDAGHSLGSQIALSRGIEQRQAAARLDPATLAETDLLIADERSWAGLSQSARESVRNAVESGMGLLLRITGPVPGKVEDEWAAMGFKLEDADLSHSVNLPGNVYGPDRNRPFTRRPLAVRAPDSVALLQAEDGSDLIRWRAMGQGRVGITLMLDSYRMTLEGDREAYGTLWSKTFSTLARARGGRVPQLPQQARVNQRSVICGLQAGAGIRDAQGEHHELLVEDGAQSCAAWWPQSAGWHQLANAGTEWPIHVFDQGEAETLQRMAIREATMAMVNDAPPSQHSRNQLPRWPFFLLWLSIAGLVWWFERRKTAPP